MGALLAAPFCAASAACCFGSAACSLCCSACPSAKNPTTTRIMYAFMLISVAFLSVFLLLPGVQQKLVENKWICDSLNSYAGMNCEHAIGYQAVYRVCAGSATFFFLFMLLMLGVSSSRDGRSSIQNGFWFFKYILMFGLIAGFFFIGSESLATHDVYVFTYRTVCLHFSRSSTDLKGFLYNANSAVRRLCRLGPGKENCILATETANEILQTLVDEIFPRKTTKESNIFTCSHVLLMCPDKDSKGKEIEGGAWSCFSCQLFLNHLLTMLSTPLPKVNIGITSILCPTKDANCLNVFTDVLQISGILGEFIQNKSSAPAVCKILKCVN